MNKEGNITVCHVLKVIIRVEKGGKGDGNDTKKKMYDIIIQYPFHLLSVSTYLTRYVVIMKIDGDFKVSLQSEVHFATTLLTNLALCSNSAQPTIAV